MKTSESIKTIAPLLLEAQKQMGTAKKGTANDYYKSSYADLNAIREVALPVLNGLGFAVLQPTVVIEGKHYVETILLHTSGEFIASHTAIVNDKGTAQAEGSGLSYARRYGLQALLNIGAVDDDAEGATKRSVTTAKTEAKSTPKSTFRKTTSLPVPKAVEDSQYDALVHKANGALAKTADNAELADSEEEWV